jgi:hypothetical protein
VQNSPTHTEAVGITYAQSGVTVNLCVKHAVKCRAAFTFDLARR